MTMKINWGKGFNRLFVVAAIGWAIFIPVERFHEQNEWDSWKQCISVASGDDEIERCNLEHKGAPSIPTPRFGSYDRTDWLILILFIVGPPLIAYPLLRGLGYVVGWVWRGFREAHSPAS